MPQKNRRLIRLLHVIRIYMFLCYNFLCTSQPILECLRKKVSFGATTKKNRNPFNSKQSKLCPLSIRLFIVKNRNNNSYKKTNTYRKQINKRFQQPLRLKSYKKSPVALLESSRVAPKFISKQQKFKKKWVITNFAQNIQVKKGNGAEKRNSVHT